MPRSDARIPARTSRAHGEFELLAAVRRSIGRGGRGVVVGIGDDAAVVRLDAASQRKGLSLVLTTDAMVEGVHFRRSWLTAQQIGVRAWRVAVSDISAMGATPRWVLLSLELPSGRTGMSERDVLSLIRAVGVQARRSGATLVGGNVSRGAALSVTLTVVGESAAKPLLRSGAKPGDVVFVTGTLGGASAARLELMRRKRSDSARGATSAYSRPPLRVAFAAEAAARGLVSAMIDVSDGLLQDLGHMADESKVRIRVAGTAIPVHPAAKRSKGGGLELALTGGEDYELAFTAPERRANAIATLAARHRVPVTPIGFVERGKPAVTDVAGRPFAFATTGFDHLRARSSR